MGIIHEDGVHAGIEGGTDVVLGIIQEQAGIGVELIAAQQQGEHLRVWLEQTLLIREDGAVQLIEQLISRLQGARGILAQVGDDVDAIAALAAVCAKGIHLADGMKDLRPVIQHVTNGLLVLGMRLDIRLTQIIQRTCAAVIFLPSGGTKKEGTQLFMMAQIMEEALGLPVHQHVPDIKYYMFDHILHRTHYNKKRDRETGHVRKMTKIMI